MVTKSGAVFRRGFLAEAEVYFSGADEVSRFASDPSWSTVERIHFLPGSQQVLDPSMRGLEVASGLEDPALCAGAAAPKPHSLVELAAQVEDRATFARLERTSAFPRLRRLELCGRAVRPSEVVQLLRSPAQRLERFAIANVEASTVPAWLDAMERFTPLAAFEVTQRLDAGRRAGWVLRFERGPGGRLSTLRARLCNLAGDGRIERITDVIETLPRDVLVRVLLERSPLFQPTVGDELRLREACKSQRDFHGVELAG